MHQKEAKVLLAGTRDAAACGHSGSLCFSRAGAVRELAALRHPAPSSPARCDARHALRRVGKELKDSILLGLTTRVLSPVFRSMEVEVSVKSKSEAIVSFLANLLPLYTSATYEGVNAARSLVDGTLVLPVDCADEPDNDDWVKILWQGDPLRFCEVNGSNYATPAVVEYVRMHHIGCSREQVRWELERMAQHFTFKTGGGLYLPYEPQDEGVAAWVARASQEIGSAALIEVLKKAAGL